MPSPVQVTDVHLWCRRCFYGGGSTPTSQCFYVSIAGMWGQYMESSVDGAVIPRLTSAAVYSQLVSCFLACTYIYCNDFLSLWLDMFGNCCEIISSEIWCAETDVALLHIMQLKPWPPGLETDSYCPSVTGAPFILSVCLVLCRWSDGRYSLEKHELVWMV